MFSFGNQKTISGTDDPDFGFGTKSYRYLVSPGNPQRCNSMIANNSTLLLYRFVYIGSSCSGKHSIGKLPELNYVYGLLLLDHEVSLVFVRNLVSFSLLKISIYY